jgi:hypothetical protein
VRRPNPVLENAPCVGHADNSIRVNMSCRVRRVLGYSVDLGHVFPRLAAHDVANGRASDVELPADLYVREAGGVQLSDRSHVYLRQLCESLAIASRGPFGMFPLTVAIAAWAAAFCPFVAHVVSARSQKQVIRVYARRIVALVANVHALWNWSVRNRVRESMRRYSRALIPKFPVTTIAARSIPKPARVGLFHPRPESTRCRRESVSAEAFAGTEERSGDEFLCTALGADSDKLSGSHWSTSRVDWWLGRGRVCLPLSALASFYTFARGHS